MLKTTEIKQIEGTGNFFKKNNPHVYGSKDIYLAKDEKEKLQLTSLYSRKQTSIVCIKTWEEKNYMHSLLILPYNYI